MQVLKQVAVAAGCFCFIAGQSGRMTSKEGRGPTKVDVASTETTGARVLDAGVVQLRPGARLYRSVECPATFISRHCVQCVLLLSWSVVQITDLSGPRPFEVVPNCMHRLDYVAWQELERPFSLTLALV
ncbi:hypothetical protein LZ31DRAFT_560764 [Colletotrichum somersetense]|nr:hypothetical protein LZ31DRAFT_560764 [Colletotrichum somersetense]